MGNSHAERTYNWTPDDVLTCEVCEKSFDLLRRRHHCRNCGSIVCHSCSAYKKALPETVHKDRPVRICDKCRWSDRWLDKDTKGSILNEARLLQQWQEQRLVEEMKRTSKVITSICSSANLLKLVCSYLSFREVVHLDSSITNKFLRPLLVQSFNSPDMYLVPEQVVPQVCLSPSNTFTCIACSYLVPVILLVLTLQAAEGFRWIKVRGMKCKFSCFHCTYDNRVDSYPLPVCEMCELSPVVP